MILDGLVMEMKEAGTKATQFNKEEVDVSLENFAVNNDVVIKVIGGLFKLQKMILDPKKVRKLFIKLRDWFNAFKGDEAEGVSQFIINSMIEVMSREENQHMNEANVLMLRYGFFQAKDNNGAELFDLIELIMITFILCERDGFYQLEQDRLFITKIFQEVADCDEVSELDDLVAESL